jgi:hypothetical protein
MFAEVYPALWSREFPMRGRTSEQHDAFSVAQSLRRANRDGSLAGYFNPKLYPQKRVVIGISG